MKAAAGIVLAIGFGFALNTASCSNQDACGSGGAAGTSSAGDCSTSSATAGSGGAAATTCGQLSALQACFTTFCASDGDGDGTPFCSCFAHGFDLSGPSSGADSSGCLCISIDSTAFCAQAAANGLDGSSVDCTLATAPLVSMCVGVQ
jgi:hypothetical protein